MWSGPEITSSRCKGISSGVWGRRREMGGEGSLFSLLHVGRGNCRRPYSASGWLWSSLRAFAGAVWGWARCGLSISQEPAGGAALPPFGR